MQKTTVDALYGEKFSKFCDLLMSINPEIFEKAKTSENQAIVAIYEKNWEKFFTATYPLMKSQDVRKMVTTRNDSLFSFFHNDKELNLGELLSTQNKEKTFQYFDFFIDMHDVITENINKKLF